MDMYTYIWVEGFDNLYEFCKKRFNSTPYMCECSGHCGGARIHEIYKEDKDGHWHEMYFIYMEHDRGEYDSWNELHEKVERAWNYEQIRLDKRSILRRRR